MKLVQRLSVCLQVAIIVCLSQANPLPKPVGAQAPMHVSYLPGLFHNYIGARIVWSKTVSGNQEIFSSDSQGFAQLQLTTAAGEDALPVWSPDRSQIVFTSRRDGTGRPQIYVMNSDGSAQVRLTHNTTTDTFPSWSPDGSQIIFSSYRDGVHAEIYTMKPDGTSQTRLTYTDNVDEAEPQWSPDGTRLVYSSLADIFVANADASGPVKLTGSQIDGYPAWSPDSSRIVYSSAPFGHRSAIWIMNVDGSNNHMVAGGHPFHQFFAAVWSPDGSRILFISDVEGYSLYTMDPDASNRVKLDIPAQPRPDW